MTQSKEIALQLNRLIEAYWDRKSPLLLALSGGPDSMALLRLLLEVKSRWNFQLGIAHVDHGWRSTSECEAQYLAELAKDLELSFHVKTLDPKILKGNLEEACRNERLQFFRELCLKYEYQAVLLGHHADDQAETVLKRVLEGASLTNLASLHPVTHIQDLELWRPLLNFKKEDLLKMMQTNVSNLFVPFEDSTNQDECFLRARMRVRIIPWLTEHFGKEIQSNLCALADDTRELKKYFDAQFAPLLSTIVKGPFGFMLDLTECLPKSTVEQKQLTRRFCSYAGISLSREGLQTSVSFLASGKANKLISCGKQWLVIDRYRLFGLTTQQTLQKILEPLSLKIGEYHCGFWNIKVSEKSNSPTADTSEWKDCWNGEFYATLPEGKYFLTMPKTLENLALKKLAKWWNNAKVPAFTRLQVPVITNEAGEVVHEFLSGRFILKHQRFHTSGRYLKIEGLFGILE